MDEPINRELVAESPAQFLGDRHVERTSGTTRCTSGGPGPAGVRQRPGRQGRPALVTAISNNRRGSGDARVEEATAIQWTLWGKQAENAAEYLGKGSHINVVGRLRNNNYDKDGETVYGMAFTAEEIDYLDSRADAEARRAREEGAAPAAAASAESAPKTSGKAGSYANAGKRAG